MPFKSDKQRRYLYANKPEVAEKFADHEDKDKGDKKPKRKSKKEPPPMRGLRNAR